ncbi:MAG: protoheme farnesyltransferase [Bacteroidota bacterium]|jgi:protoheme IX farnesyltransferase|nr:protoheme IX farnesyltransferase [Cytophagales bacterium]
MSETPLKKPSKFKTYLVFTKFRLSFLVILSALTGYLFAGGKDLTEIAYLMLGGTLVTGASNGANQIWERNLDKIMNRTNRRPLPTGEMSLREAYIIVILFLLFGTYLLWLINLKSAVLGLLAFLSYVFVYTPLKQVTPWAVFVGAFPGAIPPFLGAIAATDAFGFVPGVLFFVQFTWQFPHFWAIAWVLYDDYKKAGFSLLPSKEGKGKASGFQIMAYSLALIPFSLMPWLLGWTGVITLISASLLGIWFFYLSYKLYHSCETADARKLMFASFVYLPIIQFIYVFDRTDNFIEILNKLP